MIRGIKCRHITTSYPYSFYLIFLQTLGLYLHGASSLDCDPDVGPAGGTTCLQDSGTYDHAQYATCASHEYVLERSLGDQGCSDSVSYCYYPCMLERHGVEEGAVERDCSCDVDGSVDITTGLSEECRVPTPNDCSWYERCLREYYPCAARQEYALGFGERFCLANNQRLLNFSQCGMEWFRSASQCILVQTSSLLRNYSASNQTASNEACSLYENSILEEQSRCYFDSYGAFSICQLDCSAFALIFNLVQSTLSLDRGRFSFALKNLIISAKKCSDIFANSTCSSGRFLEIRTQIGSNSQFFRNISGYEDLVAASIVDSIAQTLNWTSYSDLKWHAYASTQASLAPSKQLDIQLALFELSSGLLNDIVRALLDWISAGSSIYVNSFDTSVDMISLKSCEPGNEMENCNQILAQSTQSSSSEPSTSFTASSGSTTKNMDASSSNPQPRSSDSRTTRHFYTPAKSSTTVSVSLIPSQSSSTSLSSSKTSASGKMTPRLPVTPPLLSGSGSSVTSARSSSEPSSTVTSGKESTASSTSVRPRRQTPPARITPPITTRS